MPESLPSLLVSIPFLHVFAFECSTQNLPLTILCHNGDLLCRHVLVKLPNDKQLRQSCAIGFLRVQTCVKPLTLNSPCMAPDLSYL